MKSGLRGIRESLSKWRETYRRAIVISLGIALAAVSVEFVTMAPSSGAASPTIYQTGNKLTSTFIPVASPSGVTALDEENGFGMALVGGQVLAWGTNNFGELGNGTTTPSYYSPVQVVGLSNVVDIDGGNQFGLAVESNGTVMAWGSNAGGDLGNGSGPARSVPGQIQGLTNVVQVSGGNNHSLALRSDGTVMAWGDNLDGDLGIGSTVRQNRPVPVPGLTHVVAVSVGCNWSTALLSNGTVEAWGLNANGQLGNGTFANSWVPTPVIGLPPISQVSAGGNFASDGHALALDTAGNVWAWGDNAQGQLGVPTAGRTSAVPVKVPGLTGIRSVSAGGAHSLATDVLGRMWIWGSGAQGQLGTGSTKKARTPVLAGLANVSEAWAGAKGTIALAG